MKTRGCTSATAAAALALILACSGSVFAARGNIPVFLASEEEEAGNNLSYPAILIEGSSTASFFEVLEEGLGETYSYGCDGTEMLGQFSYPNTSCVDDLAAPTYYYSAAECTAAGAKCEGKSVDRIYWQKEADNNWSSQVTGVALTGSAPVNARYVDWGDSIEVVSWNEESILRVETQPFVDLSQDPLAELPPAVPPETQTQTGFQMWHVSGQGITEQWGARVTETIDGGIGLPVRGLPYSYQSPYAIINAGTAELYLSKLVPEDADDPDYACPELGGGDQPPVYPADYPFVREWSEAEGWSGSCNLPVVAYTLEQSVSGKYVHGYNWSMRDLSNPLPVLDCGDPSWQKTGWWRLTFVPNGNESKMLFTDNTVTTPPDIPVALPTALAFLTEESEEEIVVETLYSPVVDVANNLTYIDICIVAKSSAEPPSYTVTPSVVGSGTISPAVPQVVEQNSTVRFLLDPGDYHSFGGVSGTCPAGTTIDNGDGTWGYTTGEIKSDCTVVANFIAFDRFNLTVAKAGSGTGTVTSSPAGIDCGADCSEDFYKTMVVTLTAIPDGDSIFAGWSGDADCEDGVVTMDAAKSCTAEFTALYAITAFALPAEGGGVSCDPNPVLHGSVSTCTIGVNPFFIIDSVTGTCGGTLAGNVYTTSPVTADCTVTANLVLEQFSLTVSMAGSGTGTVTSNPAGIDCGADCSENYAYNTAVTLAATPGEDSVFAGWSGDADCEDGMVTMDAAKSCTAEFTALYAITAFALPAEGGGVSCDPNPVLHGSVSACTIGLNPHFVIDSVTGTCGGTLAGNVYTTSPVTADCTVTANLVIEQFSLTVSMAGSGTGTVTSNPAGIDCGTDCGENYVYNTAVTLAALTADGSMFIGWSGEGCSGTDECMVTMDQSRAVTANFERKFPWALFLPAIQSKNQQ